MDGMADSDEEPGSPLKSKKAIPFPFSLEPQELGDLFQDTPIPGKQCTASRFKLMIPNNQGTLSIHMTKQFSDFVFVINSE